MCGIAGIVGNGCDQAVLAAMVASQHHRGPDAHNCLLDPSGIAGLGHNRLSIIDLSPAGQQPLSNADQTLWLVFNGEVYNYRELRAELCNYPYQTATDSEVVLAAYEHWGDACLEHFVGMFALLIWDTRRQRLFAARDRFGVKPLYLHHRPDGTLLLASEIKALHAAGVARRPDPQTWATYLAHGLYDHSERTFWSGITALPAGHALVWERGDVHQHCWYDLTAHLGADYDQQSAQDAQQAYQALLETSVRLRFRADVPVGINLSGGLDSALLLGLVQRLHGWDHQLDVFTFVTGDPAYDELPWVAQLLAPTSHHHHICHLSPADVPTLAATISAAQDEPFGGLPTLAYAQLFQQARSAGVIVLLDGQGLDEQWAGYDYYATPATQVAPLVQGVQGRAVRPECLLADVRQLAQPLVLATSGGDRLQALQYRDLRYTKIPRALRFNDRSAMHASTELREPFLDHRLVEFALRQPPERKINHGTHKWLVRQLVQPMLPFPVAQAPKRPLQTPQREWLRGPLHSWADAMIEAGLVFCGGVWLDAVGVRNEWQAYCRGASDNSFYVWQWISLGLLASAPPTPLPAGTIR